MFSALTTQDVFDGVRPAEFSQGLNSTRIKYDLLRSVKAEKMPHGQDLLGKFRPVSCMTSIQKFDHISRGCAPYGARGQVCLM